MKNLQRVFDVISPGARNHAAVAVFIYMALAVGIYLAGRSAVQLIFSFLSI